MGLLDWFKDNNPDERDTDGKPKPVYDPTLGSGWVPGISDGSWLLPDSARQKFETGTDGVTRPVRRDG